MTQTKESQEIECKGYYSILNTRHLYNVSGHCSVMADFKFHHLKQGCALSTLSGTYIVYAAGIPEWCLCVYLYAGIYTYILGIYTYIFFLNCLLSSLLLKLLWLFCLP